MPYRFYFLLPSKSFRIVYYISVKFPILLIRTTDRLAFEAF